MTSLIPALVTAIGLLACAGEAPRTSGAAPDEAEREAEIAAAGCRPTDFLPDLRPGESLPFSHARNLRIVREADSLVVEVKEPWFGAPTSARYRLVACAAAQGDLEPGIQTIAIPPRRVVTTSTVQLAHLVALDASDRLVGHGEVDHVSSPAVRRRIDEGLVVEVGAQGSLNLELILALEPDLVLLESSGVPGLDAARQLERSGVPYLLTADYLEPTPLAQAEWLELTGLLLGRYADAKRQFEALSQRYGELAGVARQATERPRVLMGAPYRGVWWIPGGRSFPAKLLADAHAQYLFAEDTSRWGVPVDLEVVFEQAVTAAFWLHPSGWRSRADGLQADPRFAELPAFRTERVFNNNLRLNAQGGNDYWETGPLRPDLVLADLIAILHPELLPEHRLYFHRQLD